MEDEPDDDEEEEGEEAGKDEEVGGDDEVTEPPPAPPVGPRPRPTARTALVYDERMEEHYNPWDRSGGLGGGGGQVGAKRS